MEPQPAKKDGDPPSDAQTKVKMERLEGYEYPQKIQVTLASEEDPDRLRARVGLDRDRHSQVHAMNKQTGQVAHIERYEEVSSEHMPQ